MEHLEEGRVTVLVPFFFVVHWLNIPVPSGSAVTNMTDASHGWLVSHS